MTESDGMKAADRGSVTDPDVIQALGALQRGMPIPESRKAVLARPLAPLAGERQPRNSIGVALFSEAVAILEPDPLYDLVVERGPVDEGVGDRVLFERHQYLCG